MKRLAYILIIILLALTPLLAQKTEAEDTLDKSEKGVIESHDSDRDDSDGNGLGGIIEELFRSAVEVYESSRSEESEKRGSSTEYYRRNAVQTESDEEVVPKSEKFYSAPAPSSTSEAKVKSSKLRDVFVDENRNGIDDSREKSSTSSTSKRRSD